MRKVKEKATGRIIEVDDEGNIVPPKSQTRIKTPAGQIVNIDPSTGAVIPEFQTGFTEKSELKAPTSADIFYNRFGRYVPMGTTAAGGIIGGIYGTPAVGGPAGTVAGSAIGKLLQGLAPQYLGEPPKTPEEALGGITQDVVLDRLFTGAGKVLGMGFPSVRKEFTESLIPRWIKPTALSQEQLAAVQADPQFPFSLGQANRFVGEMEDIFAPKAKQELVERQNQYIGKKLKSYVYDPAETMMETAQAQTQAEFAASSGAVKQAYEAFNPFKAQNTRQIKVKLPDKPTGLFDPQGNPIMAPQFKIENVEGAIPVKQAKAFADQVGDQIDTELGPNAANPEWLGANLGNPLVRLKRELDKIRGIQTHIDPATNLPYSDPISSYDQLKVMRDAINDFKWGEADVPLKKRLGASLNALEATIRNDIEEGIKEWGPQAHKTFRVAQEEAKKKALRFEPKLAQRMLDEGTDPETTLMQLGKQALSDPKRTRQFIAMTGDRSYAGQLFLNDAVDSGFDKATGRFNPDKILNYLEANKQIARTAVSSPKRTNLERLLRRAQIIGPQDPKSNVALKLRLAQGGVGLTVGAASMLSGRDWIPSTAIAGGTVLLLTAGANQLMKKVVGNQRLAHLATGMLSAAPKSNFAKQGTRALLGLMKGAQIVYLSPDGREMPGTIGEDGKVVLEKPE